jgi:hypothetical protein
MHSAEGSSLAASQAVIARWLLPILSNSLKCPGFLNGKGRHTSLLMSLCLLCPAGPFVTATLLSLEPDEKTSSYGSYLSIYWVNSRSLRSVVVLENGGRNEQVRMLRWVHISGFSENNTEQLLSYSETIMYWVSTTFCRNVRVTLVTYILDLLSQNLETQWALKTQFIWQQHA